MAERGGEQFLEKFYGPNFESSLQWRRTGVGLGASKGAGAGLAEFKRVVRVAVNFLPVLEVRGVLGEERVELRAAGKREGSPPPHIFPPSSINNSLVKLTANSHRDNAAGQLEKSQRR